VLVKVELSVLVEPSNNLILWGRTDMGYCPLIEYFMIL